MKVSDAITLLERLKAKYGDVEVFADCEKCQHATPVGVVVLPVEEHATVRLQKALRPTDHLAWEKLPARKPDFR